MEKLTITQCKVDNGNISELKSPSPFSTMINPEGYDISYGIDYSKESVLGQPDQELKFRSVQTKKITLKPFVLDATGAVVENKISSISSAISSLRKVAFDYVGSEHETPVVKLTWGTLLFYARIESMKIAYTLFKSDGTPLRAKVDLSFSVYKTQKEIQKEANRQSPDLTHLVEVRQGDSLPLLCHKIYKDSSYYLDIARLNHLTNFRSLKPGSVLQFPPLKD